VADCICYIKTISAISKGRSEKPEERKRSAKQILGAILEGPLEDFYQDTFIFDLAR